MGPEASAAHPRPEICVGAVAIRGGQLLLVRRGNAPDAGSWSVPGGRVEWGETMAEAVVRELAEETGLEGVCGSLLGWAERIEDGYHFVIADFSMTILGEGEPEPGDDAAEARWFQLTDVLGLALVPGLAELLYDSGLIEAFI